MGETIMSDKSKKTTKVLPDEKIVQMYWDRNEKAIEATDSKYGKYLYTIAYNIVHDTLDSEECVNDTYLGTWNRIPPTRPNAFQMFLSKITRNIAVDKFRKKTALIRVPSELTVSLEELDDCLSYDMSAERMSEMSEIVRILNEFLESLDDRDAFMFICRYYYSDDVSSIAKMVELSKTSVYRELGRMREELRERLEKGGISV
jgi:RNA polymerase sigma-70 factor (ECF subfamily)